MKCYHYIEIWQGSQHSIWKNVDKAANILWMCKSTEHINPHKERHANPQWHHEPVNHVIKERPFNPQ